MKTRHIQLQIALAFGFVVLGFNNCGQVAFEQQSKLAAPSESVGGLDSPDDGDKDRSPSDDRRDRDRDGGKSPGGHHNDDDQNPNPPGGMPSDPGDNPISNPTLPGDSPTPGNPPAPVDNPPPVVPPTPVDTPAPVTPPAPVDPKDDLTPLVKKAGVVTILLALGDELNDQLVIKGASSQTIAEMAVRYASPTMEPKILVVRDSNIHGESVTDTQFIAGELLKRYNTKYIVAPVGGLTPALVVGYDLIWFNNPGHPLEDQKSRDTLLAFKGGIVLSGDDMARGAGFSMTSLTGLEFVDNGENVMCGGSTYRHDNNGGYQYGVGILPNKIPGVPSDTLSFSYGNDIDNVRVSSAAVEVIAYAIGGHPSCTLARPTITRYERP